jgi:hypothetical protein
LETVSAINGFVTAWIERHFGDAAALAARRSEHFARTSAGYAVAVRSGIVSPHGFASLTAIRTTIGLVLETLLLVKALFAGTEDELTPAIDTVEAFIYVHEERTP